MNNSNQAPGFIPQQMSKITIVSAVNGLFVCGPAVYKLAVTTPYTAALVTAPCLSRALHIVSGLCDSATKHNAVISITGIPRAQIGLMATLEATITPMWSSSAAVGRAVSAVRGLFHILRVNAGTKRRAPNGHVHERSENVALTESCNFAIRNSLAILSS